VARVVRFHELAARVLATPPRLGPTRLVAIDGPGGAGKSVFAERLARALGNAPVIHTDDFAGWDEQFDWWPRLESDVLGPLAAGREATFAPNDWGGGRRPAITVPPGGTVLLEGVSSSRRAVTDRLSLAVWIEAPPETRLARGLARDGDDARDAWATWMAEEDRHYAADRARDRADVVVDGAPTIAHDPESAFVALD
jgi:uridine kinase